MYDRFESTLGKECRKLETLTGQIIYREKELLFKLKTIKEQNKLKDPGLEGRGLLADEDSEEDKEYDFESPPPTRIHNNNREHSGGEKGEREENAGGSQQRLSLDDFEFKVGIYIYIYIYI